jgi:hypothetical protein
MPAPPQSHAWGPSHGRRGWFSQTHPVSAQKMQFISGCVRRNLSIPDKWSLSSHPILSFRRLAYRRPLPDPADRLAQWTWVTSETRSVYLPLQAAQPCHSKPVGRWPSVRIDIRAPVRPLDPKRCKTKKALLASFSFLCDERDQTVHQTA